jgi:hypothetical protein
MLLQFRHPAVMLRSTGVQEVLEERLDDTTVHEVHGLDDNLANEVEWVHQFQQGRDPQNMVIHLKMCNKTMDVSATVKRRKERSFYLDLIKN